MQSYNVLMEEMKVMKKVEWDEKLVYSKYHFHGLQGAHIMFSLSCLYLHLPEVSWDETKVE